MDLSKDFECSCDICGENYDSLKPLLEHMTRHDTGKMNEMLSMELGLVRCNRCWRSFTTVKNLSEHDCLL